MYQLAIFDMDGTILNTLEDLKISINHALIENGFPERTFEEVRRFVGNGGSFRLSFTVLVHYRSITSI